jgi:DNA-binding NarL/FixJ family response regulator
MATRYWLVRAAAAIAVPTLRSPLKFEHTWPLCELMQPRVLLVDDEPRVLAAESFEVVGTTSPARAFALLSEEPFNVLVSDEEMPEMKGSQLLARAYKAYPHIPRIMLSGRADVHALARAVNDAEIFRFLAKPVRAADLAQSIHDALTLQRLADVHREVWSAAQAQHAALTTLGQAEQALKTMEHGPDRVRFAGFRVEARPAERVAALNETYAARLSVREREIVQAMAAGKRVKDIADQLSISTHTVRNHLKAVYRKLNVRSQLELLSLITRNASPSPASR